MWRLALAILMTAATIFAMHLIGVNGIITRHMRIELNASIANRISNAESEREFIRWMEFNIPYDVLVQAYEYDINSQNTDLPLDWIMLLAYSAASNWGSFDNHGRCAKMDDLIERLLGGEDFREISEKLRLYNFYLKAYDAVLGNFLGFYEIENPETGNAEQRYGLKAFSPIARGFSYEHFNDFGEPRDYGYRRRHLGNDIFGRVGIPIIAVEDGIIEALGWNQYGGWRIGIRSMCGMRYYYYAHLRRDRPFAQGIEIGQEVFAGDVIGYLGRTGYSQTENVNNISIPHLHYGMQIIFDESQKDGRNQIWINTYNIIRFLNRNRMEVVRTDDGEYIRNIRINPISD